MSPGINCLAVPVSSAQPSSSASYILLSLRRPSLEVPWGLTLSMFEKAIVIVGNVRQLAFQNMVHGFYERQSHVDPGLFWERTVSQASVQAYTSFLMSHAVCQQPPPGYSDLTTTATAQPLIPGDCLLAVNGLSVSTIATSLKDLTEYLRLRQTLTLLVYRHSNATLAAAESFASIPTAVTVHLTPAFRASYAAYRVVQNGAAVHGRCQYSSPTHPQPLAWVTPPRITPERALSYQRASLQALPSPPTALRVVFPSTPAPPKVYRNPLFTDATGRNILFEDNDDWEYDMMTINQASCDHQQQLFPSMSEFTSWLAARKQTWRKRYRVHTVASANNEDDTTATNRSMVPIDFWSQSGHESFNTWLTASTRKWKQSYSWNRQKRRKLEQDVEQAVSLMDDSDFSNWLRVRKNQWLVLSRKRHRRRLEAMAVPVVSSGTDLEIVAVDESKGQAAAHIVTSPRTERLDVVLVDALLEEQEKIARALKSRDPFNLLQFVDARTGVPDDILVHTLRYLEPMERPNLLAICRKTRQALCSRDEVWRQLCESHWKLPRRPRKPWHEIYFGTLRVETERCRMKVDALLSKASGILFKADQLQTIEKLVNEAEKDVAFDVNYSSGVVCERNSLLNLAVIHQRHKVVRWLMETKHADIETSDRGQFTPLLNAAWAGDRYLVRYFMQRGADRNKVGKCHYTKPLAAPDFAGLDAAGWADQRGHPEIAKLIRMGL